MAGQGEAKRGPAKAGKKAVAGQRAQAPKAKKAKTADAPPVTWRDAPEEHDYPAAAAYLSLLADDKRVAATVEALRAAPTTRHAAKDLLRASRLPLLGLDNPHVRADLRKITRSEGLSPVLLVRGDAATGRDLVIADGYHRVCASYHTSENTPIPARLVPLA